MLCSWISYVLVDDVVVKGVLAPSDMRQRELCGTHTCVVDLVVKGVLAPSDMRQRKLCGMHTCVEAAARAVRVAWRRRALCVCVRRCQTGRLLLPPNFIAARAKRPPEWCDDGAWVRTLVGQRSRYMHSHRGET